MLMDDLEPLTQIAFQKIRDLDKVAWEQYRNGQLQHAASTYANALELAESTHDESQLEKLRFMHGTCLLEKGELRQALTVLAAIFQEESYRRDSMYAFRASTAYLEVAIKLPISLQTIQKTDKDIEGFLKSTGHTRWRHRLLFQRARLLAERGMMQAAFETAQEAWSMQKADSDDSPAYNCDAHLNQVVNAALGLHNTFLARKYLDEWQREECSIPLTRELMLNSCQSELACHEGRFQDAVDYGRQAVLVARQYEHREEILQATVVLLKALLHSGDIGRTRAMLADLLVLRHSESSLECYQLRLLRADYYLMHLRRFADLAPLPDGFMFPGSSAQGSMNVTDKRDTTSIYTQIPEMLQAFYRFLGRRNRTESDWAKDSNSRQTISPSDVCNRDKIALFWVRAQRAYIEAGEIGKEIDAKLECTTRQDTISSRLAQLEEFSKSDQNPRT